MTIQTNLAFHPLANIFPLLQGEAFDALVQDIQQHGLRDPITLLDGQILDGRNRYRACMKAGVVHRALPLDDTESDPLSYIVSYNLHRRHLNTSQRAMVAAKIANMKHGRPIKGSNDPFISVANAAKRLNVGEPIVHRANTVLKRGAAEQVAAIDAGTLTVDAAVKVIWAREKQEKQTKPKPDKRRQRENPIRLPANTTPEELCRQGLAMEDTEPGKHVIAKKLGIDQISYKRLREIVLLNDHANDLSDKDSAVVQSALEHVNKTHAISRAYDSIAPISAKVWGAGRNKRRDDKGFKERVERFQVVMESVLEVCNSAGKLDVPYLSKTLAEEKIDLLNEARGDLSKLIRKLKEFTQ